jgi:hypothetical protein
VFVDVCIVMEFFVPLLQGDFRRVIHVMFYFLLWFNNTILLEHFSKHLWLSCILVRVWNKFCNIFGF